MQGSPYKGGREGRMLWNCVDVRDVGRTGCAWKPQWAVTAVIYCRRPQRRVVYLAVAGPFAVLFPQSATLVAKPWTATPQPNRPTMRLERTVYWQTRARTGDVRPRNHRDTVDSYYAVGLLTLIVWVSEG